MTGIVAQNVGRTSGLIKAASGGGGVWTLIKTLTSSGSDGTLDFVDGSDDVTLDSTYPIYVFKFINMHPGTHDVLFMMNLSEDGGSNWNVTKTTTLWYTGHDEADSSTSLAYWASKDLAQGTGYQTISLHPGTDNDQSCSGEMWLFNPSSTVFVKHFMSTLNTYYHNDYTYSTFCAGYGNTTSAVDGVSFKMESGEIQGGKIKLYGLKDSA